MKYQDLVVKKTWEGQDKPKWLNIGTLKTADNGKQFVELNMFPATDIYVFDRKPKEEKQEYIDVDNAPF
jgi:hypothetical protein